MMWDLVRAPSPVSDRVLHRLGPWKARAEAEFAIYEWISWYNHARRHASIGDLPPAA